MDYRDRQISAGDAQAMHEEFVANALADLDAAELLDGGQTKECSMPLADAVSWLQLIQVKMKAIGVPEPGLLIQFAQYKASDNPADTPEEYAKRITVVLRPCDLTRYAGGEMVNPEAPDFSAAIEELGALDYFNIRPPY